jgi:hypothetical protein
MTRREKHMVTLYRECFVEMMISFPFGEQRRWWLGVASFSSLRPKTGQKAFGMAFSNSYIMSLLILHAKNQYDIYNGSCVNCLSFRKYSRDMLLKTPRRSRLPRSVYTWQEAQQFGSSQGYLSSHYQTLSVGKWSSTTTLDVLQSSNNFSKWTFAVELWNNPSTAVTAYKDTWRGNSSEQVREGTLKLVLLLGL